MYRCHSPNDSQKNRHSIPRQASISMPQQRVEIELRPLFRGDEQRRAPSTAIVAWYKHAVDISLDDARETAENFGDFSRADVFRFPAIGVA